MTGLVVPATQSTEVGGIHTRAGRSPLRICILAPGLDGLGGQARQAERLILGLANEPSVEIAFIPHNPKAPGFLRHLQRIKYVRTVITTLIYWGLALTRLWKYDVIHVYSASYYSYLLSVAPIILIGRFFGKKVLLNYHSGEAEDHLKNWRLTAVPIIRLAHAVVVPSGYLVDVFAKFGVKAQAVHNVVDLDVFRYRDRSPIRPVFLTSRLHEPLYNVACALRAFRLVQDRFPAASLTVAGDGWMRPQLEQLARDLELRNTTFIGRVPGDAMPDMYDAADIYLNATNIDNMPGTLIECMSCGLPVVTTDAGGIPYIVTHQESALIVPCNDHEAMARNAIRLLEDESLAVKLGRTGRESCQRYTWPTVRDAWLATYHGLEDAASLTTEHA
jgi:L-malate glycosyltransferase